MSERSSRQRAWLEATRERVQRAYDDSKIAARYADEEDRAFYRELNYCLNIATEWCFANQPGGSPPDLQQFIGDAVVDRERLEGLETSSGKALDEIRRLQNIIAALEEKLRSGGPGQGNKE